VQWVVVILAALLLNGLIFAGTFAGLAYDLYSGALASVRAAVAADEEELVALEPSCTGDAMLAAAAEASLCGTPFYAGPSCLEGVERRLRIELDRCQVVASSEPVEIAFLDTASAKKLATIDPEMLLEDMPQPPPSATPPPPPPPQQVAAAPPPPPQQRSLAEQVIETVKPDKDVEPPDNTRFLSEYNVTVEKQKVARGAADEPMINKPKPQELIAKAEPAEASAPDKQDKPPGLDDRAPPNPGKLSMRAPGATTPAEKAQEAKVKGALGGSTAPLGDGTTARRGDGAFTQERREAADTARGEAGAGGGAPRVPDLRSKEALERVAGGGSVDHVEDVEEGDENAFSTRAWVGASFINRAKRQVAREWQPGRVWLQHDPNGQVYGLKSRVTVLKITLAPDGRLVKAVVVQPSGVDFLDDEAVRAFQAAAPFPNPPDVLRDKEGQISFTFGFYFQIGSPKGWKIFRTL
jgi:TonB family protein